SNAEGGPSAPERRGSLGERARRAVRHGAAVVPPAPEGAGGLRPGPLVEVRPDQDLPDLAPATGNRGRLDERAARALGAPAQSARLLPRGPQAHHEPQEKEGEEMTIDPKLDLVLERFVEVSPELVWMAWTQPEHLKKWFTPAPWTTVDCEIDLRPGGVFRTVMRSPEGKDFPNAGCYLEIVPNRKLVWTDALGAGFRP